MNPDFGQYCSFSGFFLQEYTAYFSDNQIFKHLMNAPTWATESSNPHKKTPPFQETFLNLWQI